MLNALRESKLAFGDDEFVTFSSNENHELMESLRSEGWSIIPLLPTTLKRRVIKLTEQVMGSAPRRAIQNLRNRASTQKAQVADVQTVRYNKEMETWLRTNKIDLLIDPISTSLSFEARIPYVLAIHD